MSAHRLLAALGLVCNTGCRARATFHAVDRRVLDRAWPLALAAALALGPARAHEGADARVARLTAAVAAAPGDPATHLARATAHRERGDLAAAEADLRVVALRAPGYPGLALEGALLLVARGERVAAHGALDAALRADAASVPALLARAALREDAGDLAGARADLDATVRLAPTPDRVLARGQLDERLGLLDRAAAGYAEGLARLGPSPALQVALIEVDIARGEPARARDHATRALASAALQAEWRLLRARAHAAAGDRGAARRDRERALTELDALLAVRPHALRRVLRARVLFELDRREEAAREVAAVLERHPGLAEAQSLARRLRER